MKRGLGLKLLVYDKHGTNAFLFNIINSVAVWLLKTSVLKNIQLVMVLNIIQLEIV